MSPTLPPDRQEAASPFGRPVLIRTGYSWTETDCDGGGVKTVSPH